MSHTYAMEKQTETNEVFTKAEGGALLTAVETEEFLAYKRKKQVAELTGAFVRSESSVKNGDDVQRVCERAVRLRQAAVKIPLTKLSTAAYYLCRSGVKIDCAVGGDGETLAKVKAYEAKLAIKRGANEVTALITPSFLDACRYTEIKREIKKLRRAVGKASLKVRMERTASPTTVARIARLASDAGAAFFSVPYFPGCERIRVDMTNGCKLEVTDVNDAKEFRRLLASGVGRVVTEKAWEIYSEWIREANEPKLSTQLKNSSSKGQDDEVKVPPLCGDCAQSSQTSLTNSSSDSEKKECAPKRNEETDYYCRLEGSDLKFL